MRTDDPESLTVDVQLMTDPCLWRWEIRDAARGQVLDNSWTREWKAYQTSEEALRAARERLTSLA
ncbi:MAG: hypothetical protein ACREJG_13015 [Candidatus Rokuibacteriota bacterium]